MGKIVFWPPSGGGGSSSNASVGPTGTTAPTSATEIGGVNAGNLVPVSVDGSGNINVNVISGGGSNASVGATGSTAPASATEVGIIVGGNLVGISSSNPVPVSATSLPLPTGAATAANQATEITSLGTIATNSALQATAANQTTLGNQTTKINDGTNTVAVKAASTAPVATDPSLVVTLSPNSPALAVSTPDLYFTGQAAQTATVNNIIPASSGAAATDASGYRSGSIQIVSTGSGGAFIFEASDDNSHFITMPVQDATTVNGVILSASITPSTSNIIYRFPVIARYIRVRIATTVTGGSIQAFTTLSQTEYASIYNTVVSPIAGNNLVSAVLTAGAALIGTVKVQDASSNVITVKAASTAPVTTDTSLVVAVNPNSGAASMPPVNAADVSSAAIITTTTTAAFTPSIGNSYMIDIPVTVVSGTGTPTMTVAVQESADAGTNWYTVYTFPGITATGSYVSPVIPLTGNRVRYVQTISGSSPSFTRAINRLQSSQAVLVQASTGQLTDGSGSTSGTPSTSTQIFAANQNRKYLLIQNLSTTLTIYLNFTSAATASTGSYALGPLGSLVQEASFVSTEIVNVLATSASVNFTAKQG